MENKYWQSKHEIVPLKTREIINEYLLSLKLENKAEATIVKYRSILERFFSNCIIPLNLLTSNDVFGYLKEFSTGKKPKSVKLYISTLSSFFKFCLAEEYLDTMLIKKRWRPKLPQTLPRYLSEQEYARVKLTAEELSHRDRAIILFLFSSGCRKSEVSNLSIHNVNLEKRTAEVKGKGKKIRSVHFSEECALVLKEYLSERTNDGNEALFINKFGNRLGPEGIYEITRKLGKKAGLNQKLYPHLCRHTFATNMLARGADLQFIADELGHNDLNTTRIYSQIPTEEMISAYQNRME
ncbi:tyrosine-type recombinase/integrase [Gottfriedia solisilvae]|uniref:Tyrosine recombinase XerC n=1 Tax=Gottfriedia solisilvae TaxID=1516104 RepID=A0A8J3AMP2_9BACI|nr:tyrosine-type recombinase/integrase [Gottfriedia solisilvae]GGI16600.1 tyrosine recombinase XerC [Gottfriedia solisilvae]